MKDLEGFLINVDFDRQEKKVTVTRRNGILHATVPCGKYVQEFFADESRESLPLPLAIVKRRTPRADGNGRGRAKPIGVLVILPDYTGFYRKGGIDAPTRDTLKAYGVKFCRHVQAEMSHQLR